MTRYSKLVAYCPRCAEPIEFPIFVASVNVHGQAANAAVSVEGVRHACVSVEPGQSLSGQE